VSLSLKVPEASRPDLTARLEAFYHRLPLSLVLPEIPEDLFLLGIVLPYPLQAPLDPAFDVRGSRASPR